MIDDDQLERLLRAGPRADAAYQPVIMDLLDSPRIERPVVGTLRWLHGGPGFARPLALILLAAAILLSMVVLVVGERQSNKLVTVDEPSPSPTILTAGAVPNFPATEVTALLEQFKTTRWAGARKVIIDAAVADDEGIWYAASGPSFFTTQTGGYYPGQTTVRVGGLSRLYLLAFALRLVDEGRLDLDAPISRYVPSWPGGDGITLRHLLDGSSGVPSFGEPVDDLARIVAAEPSRTWTSADALRLARAKPPRFEPGTRHATVDTEDALLVTIIESVAGPLQEQWMGLQALVHPPPPSFVPPDPAGYLWRRPMTVGLSHPTGSDHLVEVADLPEDVRAVLGSARNWAVSDADLARVTHDLHRLPLLLSDQARASVDRPFEDGGFGGMRMCPCNGDTQNGVGLIAHTGPYTALAVYVPSERMTVAIVANVAVNDDDLTALLNETHDLVWPAIR